MMVYFLLTILQSWRGYLQTVVMDTEKLEKYLYCSKVIKNIYVTLSVQIHDKICTLQRNDK